MPIAQPIKLPEEYLKAIGSVIVRWNQLEAILDFVLLQLLGMDFHHKQSHVIFAHMSCPQRIQAFLAIAQLITESDKTSERFDRSKKINAELERLNLIRNSVVHHKWIYSEEQVSQLNITARGKLKFSSKPVEIKELENISEDISIAGDELLTFCLEKFTKIAPTQGAIAKFLS